MEFTVIGEDRFEDLTRLQTAYKREIGEDAPTQAEFDRLRAALTEGRISFYGCIHEDTLVACCSVSIVFSTYDYRDSGVFEDFYILPEYRHRGIARALVAYAHSTSGVSTLTVGCADCDKAMYVALGFGAALGNMLAYTG